MFELRLDVETIRMNVFVCKCVSLSEAAFTVALQAAVRSGTATASYMRNAKSRSVAVVLRYWRVPSDCATQKTMLVAFPLRTGYRRRFLSSSGLL